MANGFPTGVSTAPIDVTGLGRNFMQSAVEAKLQDIKSQKQTIGENAQKVLKAMSIQTLQGLSNGIRDKYQGKIEQYRSDVMNKFKESKGQLSLQQQKEIQDGFQNLQSNMQQDVALLKRREEATKLLMSPGAQNTFDVTNAWSNLAQWDEKMNRGEQVQDPMTIVMGSYMPPTTSQFVYKRYGDQIKALDIQSLSGVKGNVFDVKTMKGLNVTNPQSLEKAIQVRDTMLNDPFLKHQYTNPDGTVNQDVYQQKKQEVENAISQYVEQQKPLPSSYTKKDSGYDFYVSTQPATEKVKSGKDMTAVEYKSNVPLESATSITYDGVRMFPEAIRWMPVPKSGKPPRGKNLFGVDIPKANLTEQGLIPQSDMKVFSKNDVTYVPYVKLSVPKDFEFDQNKSASENRFMFNQYKKYGGESRARWIPYIGAIKAQIMSDMKGKLPKFEQAIQEADMAANQGGQASQSRENLLPSQEAELEKFMKNNPSWTRQESIDYLIKKFGE